MTPPGHHGDHRRVARLHALDCRCRVCRPAGPGDRAMTPDERAIAMLAGFVVGLLLVWLVDRLTGGPGLLSMLGAWS